MFTRILVVCVGNICRSPMAEALLKNRLGARAGVSIGSAGIAALEGRPAHPLAAQLMREHGLDIAGHRARRLTPEMVLASDLVLVMDGPLQAEVEQMAPTSLGRVRRIGYFGDFDILDPIGGSRPDFEAALSSIERGIDDFQRAFWRRS
jgi:protein-tyrosine phosphatase